ncbi:ferritin-like domain-containing protein [Limnoglobus roseus]|uniref:2-imino-3-(Indol-3-yl)propanoate dimerase n=1 Tax=Limnoglobus roseus TaxID=2598579 RepID=A0A5C1A5N1_9BACT|nr:ferritin-like domain-containing protein [Limnoglobus roseus]QEL13645.1 2-imino-3-(indol-3-yl)propanoate dimerase [Limnoglobus roseus]
MAGPEFRWVRHRVTVPSDSPLSMVASALHEAPATENGLLAAGAGAKTLVIDLPVLDDYPTPAAKAEILLRKAAQIEHALMVQYLYASYSLRKSDDPALTTPEQKAAVGSWKNTITEIAKEEMAHLLTVQNLRLALSLPTVVERDDFPIIERIYPFDMHLEPLGRTSLAKYVVAESPVNAPNITDIVQLAGGGVNHVGVLYALLGVVFARSVDEVEADAEAADPWYEMVRQVAYLAYSQHPPSRSWHLPDDAFHPASVAVQGTQADWVDNAGGTEGMRVFTVGSRAEGKNALRDIGLQGEGMQNAASADSHFDRFRDVFRGPTGNPIPFPKPGAWSPAYPVPQDPVISNDANDPHAISNPLAQDWAKLADHQYALLLGSLQQYFLTTPTADRETLLSAAVGAMRALKRASLQLVQLPRTVAGADRAALPFTVPKDLPAIGATNLLPFCIATLNSAIALLDKMVTADPTNTVLTGMRTADTNLLAKLQQMNGGSPSPPPPPPVSPPPPPVSPPPPPVGGSSRVLKVRQLLDTAVGDGNPSHSGKKKFWNLPVATFLTTKVYGLNVVETTGDNRGSRSNMIKALKGEAPFDGSEFERMPQDRPPVAPEDIAFIEKWIDDGCPDDSV